MKARGMRVIDPVTETTQLEWLVVSAARCRSEGDEQHIIHSLFRAPREASFHDRSFVQPVEVRRSRRRVLFRQTSGITL